MSRRKVTIISLHFLGLNFILLVFVQSLIASSSFCSIDTSLVGTISDIVTSSTYFQLLERGDTIFKSLITMAKRIGPNLVPCGNTAVKRLRMRELSGEQVEKHQLMMMIVHRYRWSLITVILDLLAYYIIFIVSTAVCCLFLALVLDWDDNICKDI